MGKDKTHTHSSSSASSGSSSSFVESSIQSGSTCLNPLVPGTAGYWVPMSGSSRARFKMYRTRFRPSHAAMSCSRCRSLFTYLVQVSASGASLLCDCSRAQITLEERKEASITTQEQGRE
jgi:hypothetical protein